MYIKCYNIVFQVRSWKLRDGGPSCWLCLLLVAPKNEADSYGAVMTRAPSFSLFLLLPPFPFPSRPSSRSSVTKPAASTLFVADQVFSIHSRFQGRATDLLWTRYFFFYLHSLLILHANFLALSSCQFGSDFRTVIVDGRMVFIFNHCFTHFLMTLLKFRKFNSFFWKNWNLLFLICIFFYWQLLV